MSWFNVISYDGIFLNQIQVNLIKTSYGLRTKFYTEGNFELKLYMRNNRSFKIEITKATFKDLVTTASTWDGLLRFSVWVGMLLRL